MLGAPELATKEYWDARYEGDDRDGYDWFRKYSDIAEFLEKHLHPNSRILILGCGTSSLGSELYDRGYRNITSMDFSDVAINVMIERNQHRNEMRFDVMDIRHLTYDDNSFDVAIDVRASCYASQAHIAERHHGCHAMLQRESMGPTSRRSR